jgi:hypothetical protein
MQQKQLKDVFPEFEKELLEKFDDYEASQDESFMDRFAANVDAGVRGFLEWYTHTFWSADARQRDKEWGEAIGNQLIRLLEKTGRFNQDNDQGITDEGVQAYQEYADLEQWSKDAAASRFRGGNQMIDSASEAAAFLASVQEDISE